MNSLVAAVFYAALTLNGAPAQDGLFLQSDDPAAPRSVAQDGVEVGIGERVELDILKAEVRSRDNANTRFALSLTTAYNPDFQSLSRLLRVKDTTYRQSGGGSAAGKTASMYFAVSSRESALQVARHFGIQPRLRKHPGHRFLVSFIPAKHTFGAGEDVRVKLRIENVGKNTVSFQQGGMNRAERDNQYVFTARRLGRQVSDLGSSYHHGGLSAHRVLKPGDVFESDVSLSKWFAFEHAGVYEVLGSYSLSFQDPEDMDAWSIWEDHATASFVVQVGG